MNILVVDPSAERRADLADLLCELPGIEVRATAPDVYGTQMVLWSEAIDVVVVGEIPFLELQTLVSLAEPKGCIVIEVTTETALVTALRAMAARKSEPLDRMNQIASHSKRLAFERDAPHAGPKALAHHLRSRERMYGGTETLDLREWLPRTIAQLRVMIPDIVELVPIVAADTPPVQCEPAILEHVVLELILQACAALPWGGTIWLTAGPGADGEVKLDVLENGRGESLDLTLRVSAPAGS